MQSTSRISNLASFDADDNSERLLRRREAAAFLGVSLRWLENRKDIPVVNLARAASRRAMLRYRRSDLQKFVARHNGLDAEGRS